jgi:hypothetical protein
MLTENSFILQSREDIANASFINYGYENLIIDDKLVDRLRLTFAEAMLAIELSPEYMIQFHSDSAENRYFKYLNDILVEITVTGKVIEKETPLVINRKLRCFSVIKPIEQESCTNG